MNYDPETRTMAFSEILTYLYRVKNGYLQAVADYKESEPTLSHEANIKAEAVAMNISGIEKMLESPPHVSYGKAAANTSPITATGGVAFDMVTGEAYVDGIQVSPEAMLQAAIERANTPQ
jgi:hypothetical protein